MKKVDYGRPEMLVEALREQDVLVMTLSGRTPKETDMQLVNAAGEAGVRWILPNEWAPDTANEALVKDMFPFQPKGISSSWTTVVKPADLVYLLCSDSQRRNHRSREEFLHCCEHWLLVRVEPFQSTSFWL